MKLIDMHCDTVWKLMDLGGEGDLMTGSCDVTIPRMRQAGTLAQFFACFGYLMILKIKADTMPATDIFWIWQRI